MKRYKILICIFLASFYLHSYGQISTNEKPVSFSLKENTLKEEKILSSKKALPSIDMKKIVQEDIKDDEEGLPPRFGYPLKVDYTLENSGTWSSLPNGDRIWTLEISSPGALSINLLYDKFWLPEGAKFFIYSSDKKRTMGAFTAKNNKGDEKNPRGFATGLIFSDNITLEYYLPKGTEKQGEISVDYVVHGYKNLYSLDTKDTDYGYGRGYDSSDNRLRNKNINCPIGENWQDEKNAIALIIVKGIRRCTGALINNTAQDFTPYLLTARHCIADLDTTIYPPELPYGDYYTFLWHYESPDCEHDINLVELADSLIIATHGASLISHAKNSWSTDFSLLLLSENPIYDERITPYYLGWDRSGNPGVGGACIHHPQGDIKKIATTAEIPRSTFYKALPEEGNEPKDHWYVPWRGSGGFTQSGSSGAPFINSNRHVIGQLHGGGKKYSHYDQEIPDCFGKFSSSWELYTDPSYQLKHWLDPLNTEQLTLDGVSCKRNFIDQVVTTNTTITACEIYVQHAIVQNYAKLTLESTAGTIAIDAPFEVTLGSELEIGVGTGVDVGIVISEENRDPEGTWMLQKMEGEFIWDPDVWSVFFNNDIPVPVNEWFTFNMEGTQLSGQSGCSRFTGNLAGANSSLVFTGVLSNLVGCLPQIQNLEHLYVDFIRRATSMEVSGDTLSLLIDNEVVLEFSRQVGE